MKINPNDPELFSEKNPDEDDTCVLDPNNICDNCFRCLESDADYATVEIDGIYMNGERIY